MRAVLSLFVGLMAASSAFWLYHNVQKQKSLPKSVVAKYALWKTQFGKLYGTPQEDQYRLSVFGSNVETIEHLNAQYDSHLEKTGQQALEQPMFVLQPDSDLNNQEFSMLRTGLVLPEQINLDAESELPELKQNDVLGQARYVHNIRNQGSCGSCWAFSTVASLEKMYFDLNGVQVDLSQQYLVDCSDTDNGCRGGWPANTYKWTNANDIVLASIYPYRGTRGACNRGALLPNQYAKLGGRIASKTIGWSWDSAVKLANAGISIGVQVGASGGFRFVNKNDDIFDPVAVNECQKPINHAVNMIGAGTESNGRNYLLIQNSWGTGWGNQGVKKVKPCGTNFYGSPSYLTHTYPNL
jgi:Papain family cysteine protease